MAQLMLFTALLPLLAAAAAQVSYPIDQQIPPIARVGSPYSFQFAATTFSGTEPLQYSLIGNPSWLSLNEGSRTLSGTPSAGDVGFATFNVTAAGSGGSVASMVSKLFVSTESAPETKADISAVLSAAGRLSGPQTVTVKPSVPFEISFTPDTFNSNGQKLSYFAMLSDHTPLPAWISFDAPTMRFTGTTLSTTSAQTFDIILIASDTPGFAAASIPFTIAISSHLFLFSPFSQTINMAKEDEVSITDLKKKLLLDGTPIENSKIQSVTAETPKWLTFNKGTFEVSGKAPSATVSQDLTITVSDQYGDVAEHMIHLVFGSTLFASNINDLNITLGEDFEYLVPRYILAKDDESIAFDFAALADYLKFDSRTSIISGKVPDDFTTQKVQCAITATSGDGTMKDTQNFYIEVSSVKKGLQPGTGSEANTHHHNSNGKREGMIVGSVVGAVCAVMLLIALAMCLRKKKKNSKGYLSPKQPRNPRKSEISRPMFIPYGWPDMDMAEEDDLEKGKKPHNDYTERTPEHPPKLALNLAADRRDSHSVTDSIGDASTRILDIFEDSPFGIHNDTAPSQHPPDSMKIPTELAKRGSQRSDTFRKHTRRTTTVYQDQIHRSTGLPVNRRITGMGHGRHTYSPSRSNPNFSSTRRRPSTSSYTTRCTSIFSTTPSAFTQSPVARKHTTCVTIPTEARRSIRVVPASRRSSLLDRRTIDEKRSSYIRKRASAQSPFFSAGFRASSSNYTSPPAFTKETQSPSMTALSPLTRNNIVRPDDSVVEGRDKEMATDSQLVQPVESNIELPKNEFPGSLRKYRTNRPHTTTTTLRDRVKKQYSRPDTAIGLGNGGLIRRASTRHSLRAYDLKTSLNDLTGSKVFEDAEMSDSVYSAEERDIEEAERRKTLTPSKYTLPPLNLDRVDTKRNSKRDSNRSSRTMERKSKRDSKRELKRTSERDPTPYFYLAPDHEHGGKENASSSYNMGRRNTPVRSEAKAKTRAISSPERPKSTAARHSRAADARTSHRASQNRSSKLLARQDSSKERHSRKSIHSRTQSRHSGGGQNVKKPRSHSRSQSSAYPFFDADILKTRPSIGNAIGIAQTPGLPSKRTRNTITRDLSGNLTFYGENEEPTIEELDSSSIAFHSSNGKISHTARQSCLASLHLSSQGPPALPPKSAKRETAATPSTSSRKSSLGFFPAEMAGDERRECVRLSVMEMEEGRGKEVDQAEEQGRKTWGSLKTVLGRSSRWVGGGYWEKQDKEDKVFI